MDFLQNTTTYHWVGCFLVIYAVVALLIILGLIYEKYISLLDEESTLKDVVNYFLIGGAVSGGITLVMGIFGSVTNSHEMRNILSLGDLGFALVAMLLITALVSFLAPLLLIAVTFLLEAVYVTVTYLVTTIIVKPLQAWGDFLTRKTTGKEE
jgi:hypothetical protein